MVTAAYIGAKCAIDAGYTTAYSVVHGYMATYYYYFCPLQKVIIDGSWLGATQFFYHYGYRMPLGETWNSFKSRNPNTRLISRSSAASYATDEEISFEKFAKSVAMSAFKLLNKQRSLKEDSKILVFPIDKILKRIETTAKLKRYKDCTVEKLAGRRFRVTVRFDDEDECKDKGYDDDDGCSGEGNENYTLHIAIVENELHVVSTYYHYVVDEKGCHYFEDVIGARLAKLLNSGMSLDKALTHIAEKCACNSPVKIKSANNVMLEHLTYRKIQESDKEKEVIMQGDEREVCVKNKNEEWQPALYYHTAASNNS